MVNPNVKSRSGAVKIRIVAVVILAFGAGFLLSHLLRPQSQAKETAQPVAKMWTCSMHPNIKQPKAGKCPICLMDLIPVETGDDLGERQISFSPAALKLMEIQTTLVERKFVEARIRMVGKVDYDETRVKHITAWVKGRIDRLYVDFTGTRVEKGDHMAYVYSSELLEDQRALLAALEAAKRISPDSSDLARRLGSANIEAAKERLRLKGLNDKQIADIEKTGKVVDHITIYAPIGGVVIEKHRTEGTYVDIGSEIYTLADLTQLWVKLDAYESDMMWIRYGQQVEFQTEAYPGEIFKGTISFIEPVLNPKTRTVKLRVNIDNSDGRLKPGMFVRAVVAAKVAKSGMAMDPEMAGKWICPMHPSVVKTKAAACDICGMDLVTTESLGYFPADDSNQPPLVIPVSAALITGTRAVVYVQLLETEKPTFEGREIVLGPRAGDYYLVKSGLTEDEIVVTNGNFKIDAALQIQAKPSMMSAKSQDESKHKAFDVPDQFRKQFQPLVESYFKLQKALAADNAAQAAEVVPLMSETLGAVETNSLSEKAKELWILSRARLTRALKNIEGAKDIKSIRTTFKVLSDEMIIVLSHFKLAGSRPIYKIHCPMAFNNTGADWVQADKNIRNPYFGSSMLKCGKVTETYRASAEY